MCLQTAIPSAPFFPLSQLSIRALLGGAAAEELSKGNVIPDELLVDIVVEAIRYHCIALTGRIFTWEKFAENTHSRSICDLASSQVPFESGWILDGFPVNIDQAHLLETAIASLDIGYEVVGRKIDLAIDPNPPLPPPPPPALDLAVLMDIPDQCVAKRAVNSPGMFQIISEGFLIFWPCYAA